MKHVQHLEVDRLVLFFSIALGTVCCGKGTPGDSGAVSATASSTDTIPDFDSNTMTTTSTRNDTDSSDNETQLATETRPPTDGDTHEPNECPSAEEIAALKQQSHEICAAASTLSECMSLGEDLPRWCYQWHNICAFESFTRNTIEDDGSCSQGTEQGHCFLTTTGSGDDPESLIQEHRYCTGLSGNPLFVSDEQGVGLAVSPKPPLEGGDVRMCLFNVNGGEPAECGCLCSYPKDSRLECDAHANICIDKFTGLMWKRVVSSNANENPEGAADTCDGSTLAGYFDWRQPTLGELRSLVRGCPQNESLGSCGLTDDCKTPSCAQAPCSYCSSTTSSETKDCPGSACPNPKCEACALFTEGPCAICEKDQGPGYKGLYLPWELEWPSFPLLSSDLPYVFPGSTGPIRRAWAIFPRFGAPVLADSGAAVCVRTHKIPIPTP